jgi:hypothetical protein
MEEKHITAFQKAKKIIQHRKACKSQAMSQKISRKREIGVKFIQSIVDTLVK